MGVKSHELKKVTRRTISENLGEILKTTLIFLLIRWGIETVLGKLESTTYSIDESLIMNPETYLDAISFYPEKVTGTFSLLDTALRIVLTVLVTGYVIYSLRIVRKEKTNYGSLFDGFSIFFRLISLKIVTTVLVASSLLLFIAPGIIVYYMYRQSVYLLLDHPDWSIFRCMRESRMIMKGRKLELLMLDISFLGWFLIASVPLVFPVFDLVVLPYTEITYANYYQSLIGEDFCENDPAQGKDDSSNTGKPPWEY